MAGVILDAGHGGYDNGAQYDGRKEKDDNLKTDTRSRSDFRAKWRSSILHKTK